MNRILNYLLVLVVLAGLVTVPAHAQGTNITFTTLGAAVADTRTTNVTVASTTGITASSNPGSQYILYVDHEAMNIRAVLSSTLLQVDRGQRGTSATLHASGAYAFYGAAGSSSNSPTGGSVVTGGPFISTQPTGSCTRSGNAMLPVINLNDGSFYNCNGNEWRVQTNIADVPSTPLVRACTVPIGSVAYGSFGTSTTASTTAQYTASIYVPYTTFVTGITQLNGSAVDTASKKIVILYTGAGYGTTAYKLANSATAGTAATGNDAFQAIPFTSTLIVTGPALYYVGLQDDTADVNGIRTVAASTFNNLTASALTSVFGTVASSVTPPTTFTADTGPIACLY